MPKPEAWPGLNPADLRHRGQVQSKSGTPDDFGQPQETWTTVRDTWAGIRALTEKEAFQANQFTGQVTHEIKMRWTATTISPGMRFVFSAQTFLVQTVNNVEERNLELRLMCLQLNGSR